MIIMGCHILKSRTSLLGVTLTLGGVLAVVIDVGIPGTTIPGSRIQVSRTLIQNTVHLRVGMCLLSRRMNTLLLKRGVRRSLILVMGLLVGCRLGTGCLGVLRHLARLLLGRPRNAQRYLYSRIIRLVILLRNCSGNTGGRL